MRFCVEKGDVVGWNTSAAVTVISTLPDVPISAFLAVTNIISVVNKFYRTVFIDGNVVDVDRSLCIEFLTVVTN